MLFRWFFSVPLFTIINVLTLKVNKSVQKPEKERNYFTDKLEFEQKLKPYHCGALQCEFILKTKR